MEIRLNEVDFLNYRNGSGDTIEIYDILVNSERGKGIGTNLLNILKEREPNKVIFAFTRESNTLARAFYRKNGFQETLIPNFYPENSIMEILYP